MDLKEKKKQTLYLSWTISTDKPYTFKPYVFVDAFGVEQILIIPH